MKTAQWRRSIDEVKQFTRLVRSEARGIIADGRLVAGGRHGCRRAAWLHAGGMVTGTGGRHHCRRIKRVSSVHLAPFAHQQGRLGSLQCPGNLQNRGQGYWPARTCNRLDSAPTYNTSQHHIHSGLRHARGLIFSRQHIGACVLCLVTHSYTGSKIAITFYQIWTNIKTTQYTYTACAMQWF